MNYSVRASRSNNGKKKFHRRVPELTTPRTGKSAFVCLFSVHQTVNTARWGKSETNTCSSPRNIAQGERYSLTFLQTHLSASCVCYPVCWNFCQPCSRACAGLNGAWNWCCTTSSTFRTSCPAVSPSLGSFPLAVDSRNHHSSQLHFSQSAATFRQSIHHLLVRSLYRSRQCQQKPSLAQLLPPCLVISFEILLLLRLLDLFLLFRVRFLHPEYNLRRLTPHHKFYSLWTLFSHFLRHWS